VWVLARIPEQHQHLVHDVDKGDIEDLFVKVYGLTTHGPKWHYTAIKTGIKELPLGYQSTEAHWASRKGPD
jgi:hypothetical protein